MSATQTTTLIQNVTDEMEVLPVHASTADVARRAGEREAKSRTARGFPSECTGVVEREEEVVWRDYSDGYEKMSRGGGMREGMGWQYKATTRKVYRPVLIGK